MRDGVVNDFSDRNRPSALHTEIANKYFSRNAENKSKCLKFPFLLFWLELSFTSFVLL